MCNPLLPPRRLALMPLHDDPLLRAATLRPAAPPRGHTLPLTALPTAVLRPRAMGKSGDDRRLLLPQPWGLIEEEVCLAPQGLGLFTPRNNSELSKTWTLEFRQ